MTTRELEVLIVSNDRVQLRQLARLLGEHGYRCTCCATARDARSAIPSRPVDFLLVDEAIAADELANLSEARKNSDRVHVPVLLLRAAQASVDLSAAYAAGVDDVLRFPLSAGELLARLRAAARYAEFERRRSDQCWLDRVTGLFSRAALLAQLERLLANEPDDERTLVLLDLDFFCRINDRWGRQQGDVALCQVANVLQEECGADTLIARLSNNRYAVVLPGGVSEARELAEQLRLHVAALCEPSGEQPWGLTASVGMASGLGERDSAERLLEHATRALDEARASGRDCVVRFGEFDDERRMWADRAGAKKSLASSTARDLMTPITCTLRTCDTLESAQQLLNSAQLAATAVVDAQGQLSGLITSAQLERMLRNLPPAAELAQGELGRAQEISEETSFVEIIEQFMPPDVERLVVTAEARPRGFIDRATFLGLLRPVPADLFARKQAKPAEVGIARLIVPDAVA